MEFLSQTKIDFLGKRFYCAIISGVVVALSIWSLAGGIQRGIDFAGGTEIQVKFAESQAVDDLRDGLEARAIGNISLQRIGKPEDNEVLIRVGTRQTAGTAAAQEDPAPVATQDPPVTDAGEPEAAAAEGPAEESGSAEADAAAAGEDLGTSSVEMTDEERLRQLEAEAARLAGVPDAVAPIETAEVEGEADSVPMAGEQAQVYREVLAGLRQLTGAEESDRLDLNVAGTRDILLLLQNRQGSGPEVEALAKAVVDYRTTHAGLFRTFDEVGGLPGMMPEVVEYLQENAFLGPFTIRKVDYVGPAVGRELAEKAYLAFFFALAAMLVYITIRFRQLGFALGGIVALIHDGIVAAGVFNLWGGMFDLTIVAAFLTLLGYSINDTIVIFDRVRENSQIMRGSSMLEIFNHSINQTLSRTLLTSATTLLVVLSLFLFGGAALHGFAFVLLLGVIVGTYSTIFIASPVVILYQQWQVGRRAKANARPAPSRGASRGTSRGSSRSGSRRGRTAARG